MGHGVAHDRAELLVGELLRHVGLDDLCLALLGGGEIGSPAVPVGVGRLETALALALEHLDVTGFRLLGGLLQLVRDQPERVHALALARLHGVLHVVLHLLEDRHPPRSLGAGRDKEAAP